MADWPPPEPFQKTPMQPHSLIEPLDLKELESSSPTSSSNASTPGVFLEEPASPPHVQTVPDNSHNEPLLKVDIPNVLGRFMEQRRSSDYCPGSKKYKVTRQYLESVCIDPQRDTALEEIDVTDNEIHDLPSCIAELPNLETLILDRNRMVNFPMAILHCKKLEVLSMKQQRISPSISPLNLADKHRLYDIPFELGTFCSNLTELYLSENSIKDLPSNFHKLSKLRILDLSANMLKEFSPCLYKMTSLITLILSGNQIEAIGSDIKNLTNLQMFRIANNQLKSLPDELCCLKNISTLSIRNNQLKALPVEIDNLDALKYSDSTASQSIQSDGLYLDGNDFMFPPKAICEKGSKQISMYLRRMRENPDDLNELLERCRLTNKQTEPARFGLLTDKYLWDLAGNIGFWWTQLASELNFSHDQVQQFQMNYPGDVKAQICNMIRAWRDGQLSKCDNEPWFKVILQQSGKTQCDMINSILVDELKSVFKRIDHTDMMERLERDMKDSNW
ncbi:unnamed protein product [Owenia fusiformis]|uniref:Uncharacterized protein n=1 Tax=Owenia fusiformis TaxID=6347 RepID=A0A8J1U5K2_OWEFU|nr:unnamed protein product [Owenia fusiformis]